MSRLRRHFLPLMITASVVAVAAIGASSTASASGSGNSVSNFNVQTELPSSQVVPGETFNYPSVPMKSSDLAPGQVLFEQNCASCHGVHAEGTANAPTLTGVGPATIDFWISTGRMPLAQSANQPNVHPDRFTPAQTRQIVSFVASLDPGHGPGMPVVNTAKGNLAEGANLFALNCAGCHVITATGDALSNSTFATSLALADPQIIGDAVRSGPGNMPIFTADQISPSQLNSLARYVTYLTHRPVDAGGAGLGHVGPVAEGFIALFFGVGLLMLVGYWVGERTTDPREFEGAESEESTHTSDDDNKVLV